MWDDYTYQQLAGARHDELLREAAAYRRGRQVATVPPRTGAGTRVARRMARLLGSGR